MRALVFQKINHALVMADSQEAGREASPSGAVVDSRSVRTTESGGPRGYDAGKKIKGRKRLAMVDTDGRGTSIDPRGKRPGPGRRHPRLPKASRRPFPFVELVFADSGYSGGRVHALTPSLSGAGPR